jgi:hypothetical protein
MYKDQQEYHIFESTKGAHLLVIDGESFKIPTMHKHLAFPQKRKKNGTNQSLNVSKANIK